MWYYNSESDNDASDRAHDHVKFLEKQNWKCPNMKANVQIRKFYDYILKTESI